MRFQRLPTEGRTVRRTLLPLTESKSISPRRQTAPFPSVSSWQRLRMCLRLLLTQLRYSGLSANHLLSLTLKSFRHSKASFVPCSLFSFFPDPLFSRNFLAGLFVSQVFSDNYSGGFSHTRQSAGFPFLLQVRIHLFSHCHGHFLHCHIPLPALVVHSKPYKPIGRMLKRVIGGHRWQPNKNLRFAK